MLKFPFTFSCPEFFSSPPNSCTKLSIIINACTFSFLFPTLYIFLSILTVSCTRYPLLSPPPREKSSRAPSHTGYIKILQDETHPGWGGGGGQCRANESNGQQQQSLNFERFSSGRLYIPAKRTHCNITFNPLYCTSSWSSGLRGDGLILWCSRTRFLPPLTHLSSFYVDLKILTRLHLAKLICVTTVKPATRESFFVYFLR